MAQCEAVAGGCGEKWGLSLLPSQQAKQATATFPKKRRSGCGAWWKTWTAAGEGPGLVGTRGGGRWLVGAAQLLSLCLAARRLQLLRALHGYQPSARPARCWVPPPGRDRRPHRAGLQQQQQQQLKQQQSCRRTAGQHHNRRCNTYAAAVPCLHGAVFHSCASSPSMCAGSLCNPSPPTHASSVPLQAAGHCSLHHARRPPLRALALPASPWLQKRPAHDWPPLLQPLPCCWPARAPTVRTDATCMPWCAAAHAAAQPRCAPSCLPAHCARVQPAIPSCPNVLQ